MKNRLLFLLLLTISQLLQAQDMATTFRSEGKIYVVIAVASVVLGGIFFFLLRTDAKLSKLESEITKRENSKEL
ncbi:MAG: hypothetical protein MUF42_11465 [Cytophagaceae bacterium]|jgi:hypothetical protein|nr:hypothetical protein [Cytophagaceae bacterium]